jgi:predicted nucleic acid-binding protein
MPVSFFDTNVLVYLTSGDASKADRAEAIIAGGGSTSAQVLNELASVARRKMQMSWHEAHALLNTLRSLLTVHPITVEIHETGLRLAERYGLSIGMRCGPPSRPR